MKKEDFKNYDMAEQWVRYLAYHAGKDFEFLKDFWIRLLQDPEIYEEFVYYMEHGEALGKYGACGYTLIDILIFQIDHFRAILDRDFDKIKGNQEEMILMAFDTLLKMRKDPKKYVDQMQNETGTDMPR